MGGGQLAAAAQLVADAMCDLAHRPLQPDGRPAVYLPPPHPPRTSALRCDLVQHLLPDQLDGATRESIGRYLGRGGAAWTLYPHPYP